ncbi:hypothetical protein CsatB_025239 [Cannabis sativa]
MWTTISLSSVSMVGHNLSLVGFNGGPQSYSLIHCHHEGRLDGSKILTLQLEFPLLNFSLSCLLAKFNGRIAISKLLLREDEIYHKRGQI